MRQRCDVGKVYGHVYVYGHGQGHVSCTFVLLAISWGFDDLSPLSGEPPQRLRATHLAQKVEPIGITAGWVQTRAGPDRMTPSL